LTTGAPAHSDPAVEADLRGFRARARWAQVALVLVVMIDLVAVVSDVAEYRLLRSDWTLEQLDDTDTRQGAIGIVQLVALVVAAISFIRWFKRAYENVDLFPRRRRYGTGWAIGGWFVPILSLWRPKQIANDIWRATNSDLTDDRVPLLLTLWWASFIISNWVAQLVARLTFTADTIEDYREAAIVNALANSTDVASALLAIWVVRATTARQIARLEAARRPSAVAT
jgi:hypothetical protein